jgi:hypothetical protein
MKKVSQIVGALRDIDVKSKVGANALSHSDLLKEMLYKKYLKQKPDICISKKQNTSIMGMKKHYFRLGNFNNDSYGITINRFGSFPLQ